MSTSSVRGAIKTKLEGVTGVNNVYDYVFWTDNWQTVYDNFLFNNRIDCWFMGLQNISEMTMDAGNRIKTYLFNIFGYYSVKSSLESSKNFENIMDSIANEFLESFSILDGTTTEKVAMIGIENSVFAGTPAHRGQIQITIKEIEAQNLACSG